MDHTCLRRSFPHLTKTWRRQSCCQWKLFCKIDVSAHPTSSALQVANYNHKVVTSFPVIDRNQPVPSELFPPAPTDDVRLVDQLSSHWLPLDLRGPPAPRSNCG